MKPVALLAFICASALSAFAQRSLHLVPPAGATFAPGQHFDLRIEADEIQGPPRQFSIQVNGRDFSRELFGNAQFQTFPLLDAAGRPTSRLGGGVTKRGWSLTKPGRYEISAALVDTDGTRLTANSTISVLDIPSPRAKAKNIILFIGDGMGVAQRTAARLVSRGVDGGRTRGLLEMDTLETYGFVMTSSLDALVTDSSASAGSYATGNKGFNNTHGVFPDNTGPNGGRGTTLPAGSNVAQLLDDNPRVENIAELLRRTRRMATGVVTTVTVTDSTPAAFSSHSFSRYAQSDIANQFLGPSGHSVILGGGSRYFLPPGDPLLRNITSGRTDTRNLVND